MTNQTKDDKIYLLFISENLKRLRLAHGLSTTEVANVINKTRQGYLNYETGAREIGISSLIILSGYYNVTIDEMVGNPYTLRDMKNLGFRTYEYVEGTLSPTMPTNISTINSDIICVRYDQHNVEFFWRTQAHQKGQVMLFEYYNKPYISKVYYNSNGSGFFFINDQHIEFTKAQSENIVFIGVLASKLTKKFHVENFF
jgi:transcriptional regulator with XRE-family HTH domain